MLCLLALAATWIATPPPGVVTGLVEREGALVAGTQVGLFLAGAAGWERGPVSGAVIDLASGAGETWIATPRTLWLWNGGGPPRVVSLGPGARLRALAVDGQDRVWVATESGLFVRRAGQARFEREPSLPPGDVVSIRAAGEAVFAARSGVLWRLRGESFEQLASGLGDGWWDLRAAAFWDSAFYLAVPRGLWRVTEGGAERSDPGVGELRDLHADASGLWCTSSRGLWRYRAAPGPGAAAAEPMLDASSTKLLAASAGLLAATDRGVARLDTPDTAGFDAAAPARTPPGPSVAAVHAAALAYLDLAPAGLRRVEQRARGRGWLPEIRAGARTGRDRARDRDHDEVFSSGDIHRLADEHYAHDRGFEADLEFVWELDQLAAPDDAIAVSRERRLVIELRDQVLERVNRLYFERLRTADARAAELEAGKQRELELRMQELTAQLDAWTGGRFSRLLDDSPPIDRREP